MTPCTNAIREKCPSLSYSCQQGIDYYTEPSNVRATVQSRTLRPGGAYWVVYSCSGTCTAACSSSGAGGETENQCGGICCTSPLLLDLGDHGYDLSSVDDGVHFDIDADGRVELISWTGATSADAFLVLDRNGNGKIDSGAELFGTSTEQPESPSPNGFAALAVFDTAERGGNGDGMIGPQDQIWPSLQLWVDSSHDGVSQSSELTAASSAINVLLLDYKESERRDRHGNKFLYRSSALTNALRRVDVYDVFFVKR